MNSNESCEQRYLQEKSIVPDWKTLAYGKEN